MAYETELANLVRNTDLALPIISRALVETVKVAPFVVTVPVGQDKVLKFRKDGSLVAESLAEGTAYTKSANSELSEGYITVTLAKIVSGTDLTLEAKKFGGASASPANILAKQGQALGRKFDSDIKALFSGFSGSCGATTTTLTVAKLLDGALVVRANSADDGVLMGFLDYKGVLEVQKDIGASGSAVYTNPAQAQLFNGYNGASGFAGSVGGIQIIATNGLPTANTGADDVGLIFNPRLAFCGAYDSAPSAVITAIGFGGLKDEIISYAFGGVAEWNDGAGCKVISAT